MSHTKQSQASIGFLYTEVGRGHPFYLDGIVGALDQLGASRLEPVVSSVFDHSRGLSAAGWRSARWLYRKGSSGGPIGWAYERLRRGADYGRQGLPLRLLGRDIKAHFQHESTPLVVAHPTLTGILSGRSDLIYQHGEVAVPPEAVVCGASTVIVPLESAAEQFLAAGYRPEQVMVSGLCIETQLRDQAESAFLSRQRRFTSDRPLMGFYVSSGAEPKQHIRALIESITSCVKVGERAVVLARNGGLLHRQVVRGLTAVVQDFTSCRNNDDTPAADTSVILALYDTRAEENNLTARLFDRIDYLVAPAHERTNWALGLGLPMFFLTPSIGPFAPLNMNILTGAGVALSLDSANQPGGLGQMLHRLREDGTLQQMSEAGWGRHRIDGFQKIARFLVDCYGG